ncbi:MAG: histidine phosphatase family protein [Acidimicrobiales bacterium]
MERAIDAQQRIAHGPEDLLASNEGDGDIAVIGHGGVGTLWYCHLTGVPIDRDHDQPGQGHYYTIDLTTRSVAYTWRDRSTPSS